MKKVFITGLALLCASHAFAQSTTVNYPSPVSLSLGTSCVSGATFVTVNGTSISTDGTVTQSACGGTTNPGQTASAVTVTLVPSTYLAGDTVAADFPVVKWTSADAAMSCSVPNPPAGFTVSSATGAGTAGLINLAPPATAPAASSYTFAVTCGTTTTNAYASPASTSKTLTITSSVVNTACASNQVSTAFPNGAVLSRQCTGNIYWGPYHTAVSGVAWTSFDAIFGPGTWATGYYNNNNPFTPYLNAGQYMALAFTPTTTTSYATLVMNYLGSYGTNGVVSFSKTPGNFTPTDPSCVASGSNNLLGYTGPKYPGYCSIPADGSTYFVNFAPVSASGAPQTYKNVGNPVLLSYYMTKQ